MTTVELLDTLRTLGVSIAVDGERLKLSAPKDALTAELKAEIAQHKTSIIGLLTPAPAASAAPVALPRPAMPRPSLGQERLWTMANQAPASARYNLPLAFRAKGPLSLEALRNAVLRVAERHESLRTTVRAQGDAAWLDIHPTPHPDLCTVHPPTDETDIGRWANREARRPFNLEEGPYARVGILPLAIDDHVITVVMHHIVSDGWSFEVFFDELESAYAAALEGESVELPDLTIQYWDAAEWQRRGLEAGGRRRASEFWSNRYQGTPTALPIPAPSSSVEGGRYKAPLPSDLVEKLHDLAGRGRNTPFVITLTAYTILLSRWTGSQDIVLCSPTAGRDRDELRPLIGYLNNVLPLRLAVHPDATFTAQLQETLEHTIRAHANAALPFQEIASLPETASIPLSRGMFAYHGQPLRSLQLSGVEIEPIPVSAGTADFDLALSVDGTQAGLEATLVYRAGVLGSTTPQALVDAYFGILSAACDAPESTVHTLATEAALEPIPPEKRRRPVAVVTGQQALWTQDGLAHRPPSDPLQLQMTVIWERVLGMRPVPLDQAFSDLGGHSMLAVALLAMVEREMGVRLPLSALIEHPTVRDLTRAVEQYGWTPRSDCLLQLAGEDRVGSARPIVLVHSFEGHVFLYNELARALGNRHPVYGLQAAGLDGVSDAHHSVEEMAAHYVERLDQEFGDAPVSLAAMCYGVSVALEMAQRLRAKGRDVDLVLIDSSWEHFSRPADSTARPSVWARVSDRAQRTLNRWRWWLRETARMAIGSPYARREARVRRITARAWNVYTPQPYPGDLALVRAQETADDPSKRWQMDALDVIATGALTTSVVPGHHFAILRKPTVDAVADRIIEAIE